MLVAPSSRHFKPRESKKGKLRNYSQLRREKTGDLIERVAEMKPANLTRRHFVRAPFVELEEMKLLRGES